MKKINVTLKVDKILYDKFRLYCKDKGLIVSRFFEKSMERVLVKYPYDKTTKSKIIRNKHEKIVRFEHEKLTK